MKLVVEDVRDTVIEICEETYGPPNVLNDKYFIVKNAKESEVNSFILGQLKDRNNDYGKQKYLDMAAYILQVGEDVFINMI